MAKYEVNPNLWPKSLQCLRRFAAKGRLFEDGLRIAHRITWPLDPNRHSVVGVARSNQALIVLCSRVGAEGAARKIAVVTHGHARVQTHSLDHVVAFVAARICREQMELSPAAAKALALNGSFKTVGISGMTCAGSNAAARSGLHARVVVLGQVVGRLVRDEGGIEQACTDCSTLDPLPRSRPGQSPDYRLQPLRCPWIEAVRSSRGSSRRGPVGR